MPTLTGIHNGNEFYSHHYLAEIFAGDIQATLERWRKEAEAANARTPMMDCARWQAHSRKYATVDVSYNWRMMAHI